MDSDGDGVADSHLQRGSVDEPTQDILEINFRPDSDALFRAKIGLSNDNTTKEQTDEGKGIWRFAIRGVRQIPYGVFPQHIDFGNKPAGGYFLGKMRLGTVRMHLTI